MADNESAPDAGEPKELVAQWLDALKLADTDEKDWREEAREVIKIYRATQPDSKSGPPSAFNILYSNVQVMAPALYNSRPEPDIRRRFRDEDVNAKTVAQALERVISAQMDFYDFNIPMSAVVLDMLLPGRGVSRVRYDPLLGVPPGAPEGTPEQVLDERIRCENVQWDDFRRGPAKVWDEVPWVGFRHYLNRDQLRELNPKIGPKVPLDAMLDGADKLAKTEQPRDQLKRAEVWEIWDKKTKRQIFIAKGWPSEPLRVEDDPLQLEGFFPCPRPLYRIEQSDSLIPIDEYRMYKEQAKELENISKRIIAIVKVIKWRGIYDASMGDAVKMMAKLEDGELAASERPMEKLDSGIWVWPVEKIVTVLQQLYVARDATKQSIYEITGISDILRGATNANETATAQNIKAQTGSVRLSWAQGAVQRYARDLIRMMAEIISTKFQPMTIMMASGMQLDQNQIQLMRTDVVRDYRIDIETDSTIRADVSREQAQFGEFTQGFSMLAQGIGAMVQQGAMSKPIGAQILEGFVQHYKLPRKVEDAFEAWANEAQQPEQEKPDPKAQLEQQKFQLEQQRFGMEQQTNQQKAQLEAGLASQKAQQDAEKHQQEMTMLQEKHAMEMQGAQVDMQAKMANHAGAVAQGQQPVALNEILAGFQQLLAMQTQLVQQQQIAARGERDAMMAILRQVAAPKRIVRNAQGRAEGVEPVAVQ